MYATIKDFLKRRIGLDRAIGASSLTQLMRFVTAPITMVLMIRYFSPEEQGFYYSFGGVIGLQVFLEAGFAQSITQFTSKEFASLRFNSDGVLTGSPAALSRLRSLFQQANRYYRIMAVVLVVFLSIGGYWFFSSKPSYGVPWLIPWLVACSAAGIGFLITPFWAFLEGCNRVAQVATFRMWSTLASFFVMAIGLMMGLGIYVVVWGAVFTLAFPIAYLALRWRKLIFQVLRPPGEETISWRKDIWGFQWRIAGNWAARYLSTTAMTPLVFNFYGAAAAGQFGMTFQISRMIVTLGSAWTVTKLPFWGTMIQKNHYAKFILEWKKYSIRHLALSILLNVGALLVLTFVYYSHYFPRVAERLLPPLDYSILMFGAVSTSLWLVLSHYFRCQRMEPYFYLSIGTAVTQICLSFLGSDIEQVNGVALAYGFTHVGAAGVAFGIWKKLSKKIANIKNENILRG